MPLHEWSLSDKEDLVTWIFEEDSFVPQAKIENNETYSIITDHLGTPIQAYHSSGKKVWEAEYDIYGKIRNIVGKRSFMPFRYQGQYEDAETGLYYNRFRYYSPESGAYISQDPIGLAGGMPNLYAYVYDSNSQIDPFGLMPWPNPVRQGHHLVYKNKAASIGLDHLASSTDTPTYFFNEPYTPGSHEAIHRAQKPHVGPTRGPWTGTADELFEASKKGLKDVDHIKGELRIPKTGEVLAKNATPLEAFEALEKWHKNKISCG
nr:RHS repeat-associated core domain-containing protein [Tenacibaculum mesophilum]